MYQKILVPLDGSKLAECVLPHVEEIAKGCHAGEVVLLRVCEPPIVLSDYPGSESAWEEHLDQETTHALQRCSLYLHEVEERLRASGINVRSDSLLGRAAEQIVDYAARNEIDLIVMASHGRSGPSRWGHGNVSEKVFRGTCVPILMVRAPGCFPGI